MKKTSLLKVVVVIGLSLLLVANLVSVVFADDSDWIDPVAPNTTNNTTNNTTSNTSTNSNTSNNSTITNSITTPEPINSITTNTSNNTSYSGGTTTTLNTSTNDTENEVNNLAYTGIENNSMLVVVILIGVIAAGYSFKKIKEYNKIK